MIQEPADLEPREPGPDQPGGGGAGAGETGGGAAGTGAGGATTNQTGVSKIYNACTVGLVEPVIIFLFAPSLGSENTAAPGNPTTVKGSGSVKQIVEIVLLWISAAVHFSSSV